MPEDATADVDEGGGAPAWMLTYGDSVTLLLTFFVMLLTFSTPNKEDFQALAHGMMEGSRQLALFAGEPGAGKLTAEERRLEEARLDTEGAEKPPIEQGQPVDELRKHYEEVDISQLRSLKGAVVIRIPLKDLFGADATLSRRGQAILHQVIKMTRAKSYSIVVTARAGEDTPQQQRELRSVGFAVQVTAHLRKHVADTCRDVGLSDNIQLVEKPLPPGTCEIVMLEV
ncbi:MAG: flagellar motor protein MotB [Candidatus Brocadiaceae bacterium]|jgi:flagellar motor protein MotB